MLKIYNTLSRKKEDFEPFRDKEVGMYSCGPTVYDYPHIGNLRTYIMVDIVKRYLLYQGYKVKHVMNITDVGHLTSDADEGEDKLEKGAKREGKTVWEIAEFYTTIFKGNLKDLNIIAPDIWAKATDHIEDQVELIKRLKEKGYVYETSEALYFDVSKFSDYTKLSGQPLEEKITGARSEIRVDPQKRHPHDFALWFKRVGKFANHTMHWSSPWGEGFPGWHIECSAMSMKYLGESFDQFGKLRVNGEHSRTIDIHIGGVDHIPVHHPNEIAQSEGATGKKFVKYWIHGEHLSVEGKRMAKSAGTFISLADIKEKGFSPLAFRLLVLQAHYRSKLNFTWKSLEAAQESLNHVENVLKSMGKKRGEVLDERNKEFINALDDDLNTPQALSVFFKVLSQASERNFDQQKLLGVLLDMDEVLGLGLNDISPADVIEYKGIKIKNETKGELSQELRELMYEREEARKSKDWERSDELRRRINEEGYNIGDTGDRYVVIKHPKP